MSTTLRIIAPWAAVLLLLGSGCTKSKTPPGETPKTSGADTPTVGVDKPRAAESGAAAKPAEAPVSDVAPAPSGEPPSIRKATAREECTRSCVRQRQMEAMAAEAIEASCRKSCDEDPRSWPR